MPAELKNQTSVSYSNSEVAVTMSRVQWFFPISKMINAPEQINKNLYCLDLWFSMEREKTLSINEISLDYFVIPQKFMYVLSPIIYLLALNIKCFSLLYHFVLTLPKRYLTTLYSLREPGDCNTFSVITKLYDMGNNISVIHEI